MGLTGPRRPAIVVVASSLLVLGCPKPVDSIVATDFTRTPGHLRFRVMTTARSQPVLSSGAGRYELVHYDWTQADRYPENLEQHIACFVEVRWTEASFGGDAAAGALVEGPFECPTPTATTLVMDRFTLTRLPENTVVSSANTKGLPDSMIAPGRAATLGVPMEVFLERHAAQVEALAARFRPFAQPLSALPPAHEAFAATPPAQCELGEDGSGVVRASLETWRWIASAPLAPTSPPLRSPVDGPEALALVKALSTGQPDDLASATRLLSRQRSVIAVVGVSRALPDSVAGVDLSGVAGEGVLWLVSATSRAPPCYRTWQVNLGRALKLKRETSREYEARTFLRYGRLREETLNRTLEALLPWPNPALVPLP